MNSNSRLQSHVTSFLCQEKVYCQGYLTLLFIRVVFQGSRFSKAAHQFTAYRPTSFRLKKNNYTYRFCIWKL